MNSLPAPSSASHDAVGAFADAARLVPSARWATPRAPGKWSPGQVVEHVALTYEQSRRMLLGTFTGAAEPPLKQLLARWFGLRLLLKRGNFGKGALKGPDFIKPGESPASSADVLARLEGAAADLERAAATGDRTKVDHPIFGWIPIADLLRFLTIHTQHHRRQLSPAPTAA